MTRGNQASSQRRSTEIAESVEQNDSEEDDASAHAIRNDSHVKGGNTSQRRRNNSEDSSRSYSREIKTSFIREQGNFEDTEIDSPNIKSNDDSYKTDEYSRTRTRYSNIRANKEKIVSQSLEGKKRRHSKHIEKRKLVERPRTTDHNHQYNRVDGKSSVKSYSGGGGSFTDKSQRRKKNLQTDDEVPITEILKKAQENIRTKYEEPVPLPELTTDVIYIQGRNGFSAVKIDRLRQALENDTTSYIVKDAMRDRKNDDPADTRTHTLIRVAILAQKFWKCTGLVYQGLLGGMALLHFVMIYIFFNSSVEFISNYSIFSEIYTNIFSFLITLCVISIFDKFDLARLDVNYLREVYMDHAKALIAAPLYLITFGFHQASSKIDDQLTLTHYYNINETMWSNNTALETFLDELNAWQRITMSKDLLAVFAWFFVALGTRDNMLLTHLESMEKYASDVDSPG